MPNYAHEGTPVLCGRSLYVYHSGEKLLTLFDPRRGFHTSKHTYVTLHLMDGKTTFEPTKMMMYDWDTIIDKNLYVDENYQCYTIDVSAGAKFSRQAAALVDGHELGISLKEAREKYQPVACRFDPSSMHNLIYKGIHMEVPVSEWREEMTIYPMKENDSPNFILCDPNLKVQAWHAQSMDRIRTALKLYKAAAPTATIRHRS